MRVCVRERERGGEKERERRKKKGLLNNVTMFTDFTRAHTDWHARAL